MGQKTISIMSNCYNEEDNIKEIYSRLSLVLSKYTSQKEFLFVENGSSDNTYNLLQELANSDSDIKIIERGVLLVNRNKCPLSVVLCN